MDQKGETEIHKYRRVKYKTNLNGRTHPNISIVISNVSGLTTSNKG
jgi:hypothetical protein